MTPEAFSKLSLLNIFANLVSDSDPPCRVPSVLTGECVIFFVFQKRKQKQDTIDWKTLLLIHNENVPFHHCDPLRLTPNTNSLPAGAYHEVPYTMPFHHSSPSSRSHARTLPRNSSRKWRRFGSATMARTDTRASAQQEINGQARNVQEAEPHRTRQLRT